MAHWKSKDPKPKTRFCWECSRQLHGRQHAEVVGYDGNKHAVHKACARKYSESDQVQPGDGK